MKQIRLGVFETNSSSVHTLIIASKAEFKKFKNGELFIDMDSGKFIKSPSESQWEDEVKTYFDFFPDYMEDFEEEYTTENGEEIVVFGYYGHDG